jgi:hypothetical protein
VGAHVCMYEYFNGSKLMSTLNYVLVCPLANLANRPVFSEQANLLVITAREGGGDARSGTLQHIKLYQMKVKIFWHVMPWSLIHFP